MFILLSRVLVWLLIGTIVFSVFQRFYPKGTFVGRLVLVIVLIVVALSFVNPNEPAVRSLWELISFPLRPLGGSVLMLIFAAQKIKEGGIGKPGGYLVGWALTILLLASTPVSADFLVRAPIAMLGDTKLATGEIVQNYQLASSSFNAAKSGTLLALGQNTQSDIAFNSLDIKIPPYLLQNPQDTRTRGLQIQDFVPNAAKLQQTTQIWESYLNQVYVFLRGRQT